MSRKLFSSIITLVLCCISLLIGVFAAQTASVTFGGSIIYTVQYNVTAKVTNVEFTNVTTYCTYYSSSAGHNTLNTSDLFNITVPNANVTITDSNNCLTITNSGTGTNQTITYTGYTNYTGTLTCKIISTGQSATITYTTKYTNYDHAWEWKDNGDDAHWEECTNCAESQNEGFHEYSSAEDNGDGTHNATCDVCGLTGYEYYHVESNGENERDDYDDSNCWNYCDLCGAITDEQEHYAEYIEYDDTYHWTSCNYCGYEMSRSEHILDMGYDENYHWGICGDCEWSGEPEEHTYSYFYGSDAICYAVCSLCTYDQEMEHELGDSEVSYGDWEIDTPATCMEDGIEIKNWQECATCFNCGESVVIDSGYTERTIYAEGHDLAWVVMSDGTGYHKNSCTKCGNECEQISDYSGTYIDQNTCGHYYACCMLPSQAVESRHNTNDGRCDYCGYWISTGASLSLALAPASVISAPAVSTYGVVNNTLNKIVDTGVLDVVEKSNQNNLMNVYKKQYITKVKKILSLLK